MNQNSQSQAAQIADRQQFLLLVNRIGGRVFGPGDALAEVGQHCLDSATRPGELVASEADLWRARADLEAAAEAAATAEAQLREMAQFSLTVAASLSCAPALGSILEVLGAKMEQLAQKTQLSTGLGERCAVQAAEVERLGAENRLLGQRGS